MTKNKTSTNNILDLTCLKSIVFHDVDEIILPDCLSPDFLLIFKMLGLYDFKVTYVLSDEVCPVCGGKLHSKSYPSRKPNGLENVRIKDYECSVCHKRVNANFDNFIEPSSNYTRAVKHWGVKLSEIGEESYEKKSELFQAIFDIKLPKSTVFDHQNKVSDTYLENKEALFEEEVESKGLKDNGVYHYDEQFPRADGDDIARLMMLDSKTMYPYNDFLENATIFDVELIEKYFHLVLDEIPHEVMVTDGYSAYPAIIESFDMLQQRCVFHMMYNVGQEVYPVINRITRTNKGKYTQLDKINEKLKKTLDKYEPTIGPITDKKQKKLHDTIKQLEKEIRTLKKTIKHNEDKINELDNFLEKISNIFKAENLSLAKGRLSRLTNNTNFLPNCIANSANRIKKNFKELTAFMENELIPKTNNLIELYFKTTLPGHLKRRYRTITGLLRRLKSARIRWIQRNVLKDKSPINNFFNYDYINQLSP